MSHAGGRTYGKSKRSSNGGSRSSARSERRSKRPAQRSGTGAPARYNARTGGFLGIETKYHDTFFNAVIAGVTPDMVGGQADPALQGCLNSPAQGPGPNQRVGRTITVTSCLVQGLVQVASSLAVGLIQPPIAYLALVLDRQTNGSVPGTASIYSNPTGSPAGMIAPVRNLEFTQRFRVLKVVQLAFPEVTQANATAMSGSKMPFSMSWKGEILTNMNGADGTLTQIVDNSLHVVAFTDDNTPVSPFLTYNARIRFRG